MAAQVLRRGTQDASVQCAKYRKIKTVPVLGHGQYVVLEEFEAFLPKVHGEHILGAAFCQMLW